MRVRIICLIAIIGICLEHTFAAPNPKALNIESRQDLVQRFVEFLHEDKEFNQALEQFNLNENHLVRNRRQAEGLDDGDNFEPKKPGFFDKAAKFVVELLQRFLKWVNSNDDD